MAKKFKRENCDSTLRATVTDQLGRTVFTVWNTCF